MSDFQKEYYQVFQMFNHQWGLVASGTIDNYNCCTIGWGSLGSVWGGSDHVKPICTVYVNENRYTNQFLLENDYFTVSFFPESYRKDLAILGTLSGRDGDKVSKTSLTPVGKEGYVYFEEAELTLVCKKVYWDKMKKDHILDQGIIERSYLDEPPHHFYMGEIIEVKKKTAE
ncbi:MAG: flavin reductase [Solobacterium sp.]|nr:flavin reductase [Solobacterium sp.]